MIALRFEISTTGLNETIRGLDKFERRLANMKTPLADAAKEVAKSIGEGMKAGGSPNSFAPLKPATIARTPNRIGGPLLNTGSLYDEATDITGEKENSAYAVSETEATVGVKESDKRANVLQFGFADRNIPAREYVRATEEDVDSVYKIFEDYTDKIIEESFK